MDEPRAGAALRAAGRCEAAGAAPCRVGAERPGPPVLTVQDTAGHHSGGADGGERERGGPRTAARLADSDRRPRLEVFVHLRTARGLRFVQQQSHRFVIPSCTLKKIDLMFDPGNAVNRKCQATFYESPRKLIVFNVFFKQSFSCGTKGSLDGLCPTRQKANSYT